jgi:uncharacterized membrane protein
LAQSTEDSFRLHELHNDEADFRRNRFWLWVATLWGPPLLSVSLLVSLVITAGLEFTARLVATTALALGLFGRFIILAGAEGGGNSFEGALSSFQLAVLIMYMDVMVALMLAFHIGFLFRIPFLGPRAAALLTDGHFILESHPWMRRATFIGLVAFVCFPLAATGSVGGSIFGRLLGMSRAATFAGICIGSLIGNGAMYAFSDFVGQWIDKDHPGIRYGGIVIIIGIILLLERRYRSLRNQFASQRADRDAAFK